MHLGFHPTPLSQDLGGWHPAFVCDKDRQGQESLLYTEVFKLWVMWLMKLLASLKKLKETRKLLSTTPRVQ